MICNRPSYIIYRRIASQTISDVDTKYLANTDTKET